MPHPTALVRVVLRLRVAAAAVAVFALLSAGTCADEVAGPAVASGSYNLTGVAVGGVCCSSLPVTVSPSTQVSSGTLTFSGGSSFSLQIAGTQSGSATTFQSSAGSYVQNGGTINFTPSVGSSFTGTISDNNQIRIPVSIQGTSTTVRFDK